MKVLKRIFPYLFAAVFFVATYPVYALVDVQKLPRNVYIDLQRCGESRYIVVLHELNLYWDRSYKWTAQEVKQAQNGSIIYTVNDREKCD